MTKYQISANVIFEWGVTDFNINRIEYDAKEFEVKEIIADSFRKDTPFTIVLKRKELE